MNKHQFRKGDRVIVLENELYPDLVGFIGTVAGWLTNSVGVEFDRDPPSDEYPFHDLGGAINGNRGWYLDKDWIAYYDDGQQLNPVNTDALFN